MVSIQLSKISLKGVLLISFIFLLVFKVSGQEMPPEETEDWSRKPEPVSVSKTLKIPSDAIVLFSDGDMTKWCHVSDSSEVKWKVKGKIVEIKPKSGSIRTVDSYGSCQFHIEWKSPLEDVKKGKKGQQCGNSGVYFMGLYEVQILNSFENETYYNGQASSIYKQHIPLVNASSEPGQWQVYDIIFTAPVFEKGNKSKLVSPAFMTVLHNGVLVQNHAELKGPTIYRGIPEYKWHSEKLPVLIQDHGNRVSFRNIWIRNL